MANKCPNLSTRYGGENENRRGNPHVAVMQREFYRWVETQATEEELKEYVKNKDNPCLRRRFIQVFLKADNVKDFCEVTNQTHGKPKEDIQISGGDLTINIVNE